MSGWQHGSRPAEAHRCLLDQMVPEPKGWALIVAERGAGCGQMGGGIGLGIGLGLDWSRMDSSVTSVLGNPT